MSVGTFVQNCGNHDHDDEKSDHKLDLYHVTFD